jgi:hypothetical protein
MAISFSSIPAESTGSEDELEGLDEDRVKEEDACPQKAKVEGQGVVPCHSLAGCSRVIEVEEVVSIALAILPKGQLIHGRRYLCLEIEMGIKLLSLF